MANKFGTANSIFQTMQQIYTHINKLVHKIMINKKGQLITSITLNWYKIVGDRLYDVSHPSSIMQYNTGHNHYKCLIVYVINPAIFNELFYMQNTIVDKVNMIIGYKAINKIKIESKFELWN